MKRLRTLGVMPNMDEVDESPDTVNLATDCVHRIRARIESRRAPERGYALMISSPYQGDGKTTLAVSLGWSYAESGYRTVIVDADFIGRSMTHQFGRLREPGLREIVRSGKLNGEVVELGHPNLNLLGVGFDRRVSAANLNPGVLRRVIEALREEFDIIIVDTGPMTASIEALPVASVSDGVVLALRRGRSRSRVMECIQDIRGVGADYLGIVLNYADQADCMRYGSTSRTSMEVIAALEAAGSSEKISTETHPLLGRMPHGNEDDEETKG
jgi:Mrp family chromosome partitioning ATPase